MVSRGWRYALVQILVIAGRPLPDFVEPMKAQLIDSPRPADWIYEIKFDLLPATGRGLDPGLTVA
jgi:hypothetical protein